MAKGLIQGLLLVALIMIGLGLLWYVAGGPDRSLSREGLLFTFTPGSSKYVAYPVPSVITGVNGARTEGDERSATNSFGTFSNAFGTFTDTKSPYSAYVSLDEATAGSPQSEEYVVIRINGRAEKPIVLTGWKIESTVTNTSVQIGEAANTPVTSGPVEVTPISAPANSTVYVHTGRSPLGTSFRTNLCTGYLEQYYDFTPKLSRECPSPEAEAERLLSPIDESAACDDALRTTKRCEMNLRGLPAVSNACANLITRTLTYAGCVEAHRNAPAFTKNTWYAYLNQPRTLFRERGERIRLLDENGLTVDVVTY